MRQIEPELGLRAAGAVIQRIHSRAEWYGSCRRCGDTQPREQGLVNEFELIVEDIVKEGL